MNASALRNRITLVAVAVIFFLVGFVIAQLLNEALFNNQRNTYQQIVDQAVNTILGASQDINSNNLNSVEAAIATAVASITAAQPEPLAAEAVQEIVDGAVETLSEALPQPLSAEDVQRIVDDALSEAISTAVEPLVSEAELSAALDARVAAITAAVQESVAQLVAALPEALTEERYDEILAEAVATFQNALPEQLTADEVAALLDAAATDIMRVSQASLEEASAAYNTRLRDAFAALLAAINRIEVTPSATVETPPAADPAAEPEADLRYEVSPDDDPALGNPDAPVVIIEFSDFGCPYCARFHNETLGPLLERFGDQVYFVYRDYPILGSIAQAEAAQCAAAQDAFWPYADLLFANLGAHTPDDLLAYATQLELDMAAFSTCVAERAYQAEVEADLAEGQQLGARGTPTFYVNGREFVGAQPLAAFIAIIEEELAAAGVTTDASAAPEQATEETAAAEPTQQAEMTVEEPQTGDPIQDEPAAPNAPPPNAAATQDTETAVTEEEPAAAPTAAGDVVLAALRARYDGIPRGQVDGMPALGSPDAPVVIHDYAAFNCGFCAGFSQNQLGDLLDEVRAERVRYVFVPVLSNVTAGATAAAFCAEEQGAFWEMHDLLFESLRALGANAFVLQALQANAQILELDLEAFNDCLFEETEDGANFTEPMIERLVATAALWETLVADNTTDAGVTEVTGTPTLTFNGLTVDWSGDGRRSGAISTAVILEQIDQLIAAAEAEG